MLFFRPRITMTMSVITSSRCIHFSGGDIPTYFTGDKQSAFIAQPFSCSSHALSARPRLLAFCRDFCLPEDRLLPRRSPRSGYYSQEIELSYCFQLRFKDGVYLEMLLVTSTLSELKGGGCEASIATALIEPSYGL